MTKVLIALAFVLLPSFAFAHVGVGDTHGIAHGFLHPISGIDHVLTMLAVGVFAAHLGGRAKWSVPLSFVGTMALGGALGAAGVPVPFVETGIGLSVVVLGLIVALGLNPPVVVAMALVGFFAIFHGHAHGAEMPETASGLAYGAGFILTTTLLHVAGVGLGVLIGQAGQDRGRRITQVAGGAMAVAGLAILGGAL